jgi:hypothetical protein
VEDPNRPFLSLYTSFARPYTVLLIRVPTGAR